MTQVAELTFDRAARPASDPILNFHAYDPAQRAALRQSFIAARPFPHIVIDDFVRLPPGAVCAEFPEPGWTSWKRFTDAYQHEKRTCGDIDVLPPLFQNMISELSRPPFLRFLEEITGLSGLMPDPYLTGGGLHSSGAGGILAPHADFHAYGRLAVYRRINILIYFNEGWRSEDGGSLELFRKGESKPAAAIVPSFGRMVMFLTDDRSIHGFTEPVADGRCRNSLALYYYTSEDDTQFKGDGVTYWQVHGKHSGTKALQLLGYKMFQHGAWTLSKWAHRLNPNFKPTSTRRIDRTQME